MNRFFRNAAITAIAIFSAAAMNSCGSENSPGSDEAVDVQTDVIITQDVQTDNGTDTIHDEGLPETAVDTVVDNTPDTPQEIPVDEEPPVVVATYPENEETGVPTPVEVRVTFNEDMRFEITVNKNTFKMFDVNDQEIPGEFTYDKVSFTVTFKPDSSVQFLKGTPYRVTLFNQIQDRAGNPLAEYTFRFSTEGFQKLDVYEPIAEKYAPVLYQSTDQAAPQYDYPTILNFDGDWQLDNNFTAYQPASSVPAWVYYDVIETYTHFFIRYVYYYVRHTETENDFGNEVAGAMVVVQKNPEKPIAVETYFGSASMEDLRSFVTAESGLVTDRNSNSNLNDDRKYYGVNWVFPEAQLFPNGHFQNYLTKSKHESCAWIHTTRESSFDYRCDLQEYMKPQLKILHFAFKDGQAQNITTPFPYSNAEGNEIGYGLRRVLDDWWVRRDRTGAHEMFTALLRYAAPSGLVGDKMPLPRSFRNSLSETTPGSRTPWTWGWNPSVPDPDFFYTETPEGTIFLHPAYYFALRHRLTLTDDNTGFSGNYCFNPYLLIDKRGVTADCTPLN